MGEPKIIKLENKTFCFHESMEFQIIKKNLDQAVIKINEELKEKKSNYTAYRFDSGISIIPTDVLELTFRE